jgi:hypothetical protein
MIRSLVLIGALAVFAAPVHSALALKVINAQWGWVVARQSTASHYTPAAGDRGNSTGAVNTIDRTSAGHYIVHMPGLQASGTQLGTALVTTMGATNRSCIVGEWDSSGTEETVLVRCYALNGTAADSNFSANYFQAYGVQGRIGYAWAEDPTFPGQYTPNSNYTVNSKGGAVTVNHDATGHYIVTMAGLGAPGGNAQVSDVFSPGNCRISSWQQSGPDEVIDVICRTLAGVAANRSFAITYVDGTALKGPSFAHQAYAFANKPTTASYIPASADRYSTAGQAPKVQRLGTGTYVITFPGQSTGGGAQVTTYQGGAARCVISSIRTSGPPAQVGVSCVGGGGAAKDSAFTIAWAR